MFKYFIAWFILLPSVAFSGDIDIVDYIVDHNSKIRAERALQGMNVKVEGRASAYMGALGDTTDKGAVGITVSVPLLDTREKKERQKEIALSEESVREKASQLLLFFREAQAEQTELSESLNAKYSHLEWMRKRVQAGVEYRKEYNKEYEFYTGLRKTYEQAKAKLAGYVTSLLSLVEKSARAELKTLLERKQ